MIDEFSKADDGMETLAVAADDVDLPSLLFGNIPSEVGKKRLGLFFPVG